MTKRPKKKMTKVIIIQEEECRWTEANSLSMARDNLNAWAEAVDDGEPEVVAGDVEVEVLVGVKDEVDVGVVLVVRDGVAVGTALAHPPKLDGMWQCLRTP